MAVIYWHVDWIEIDWQRIEFSWVLLLRNKKKKVMRGCDFSLVISLYKCDSKIELSHSGICNYVMPWCFPSIYYFLSLSYCRKIKIVKMWRRDFRCYFRLAYGTTELHILDCESSLLCGICINSLTHFVRVGFKHNTELRDENKYMAFRRD